MSRLLERKTILVGLSGGIACYKTAELVRLLVRAGAVVHCLMTRGAQKFLSPLTLQGLTGNPVATDVFDLAQESHIGHIRLADSADALVIAPASANLLARLAAGMADDVVTTVALATRAPLIVAPSMNVNMYEHAATQANIALLKQRGVRVVEPAEGELACGWYGRGRLADPSVLFAETERALATKDLAGESLVVTAGPTREPIDAVRFLSNRSSGKMGYALAAAAWQRGAAVTLISGPTALPPPPGVSVVYVESAEEMREAVFAALGRATIVVMCAAVADYRPKVLLPGKMKKSAAAFSLELVRTPDILEELGEKKQDRIIVGFAAEVEELESHARLKLERKHLDVIVANDVSSRSTGFESDANAVLILDRFGVKTEIPLLPKSEVAHAILDHVVRVRQSIRRE